MSFSQSNSSDSFGVIQMNTKSMHSNDGRDGLLSGGTMLDRSLLLKCTNTNMTLD